MLIFARDVRHEGRDEHLKVTLLCKGRGEHPTCTHDFFDYVFFTMCTNDFVEQFTITKNGLGYILQMNDVDFNYSAIFVYCCLYCKFIKLK